MEKRKDYIGWDEYFMGVALLSAERSKDASTQVGACIVSEDNKILSIGYNGFPVGCSDDELPWEREGDYVNTKYPYICHAELNAILNYTGTTLRNSTIYVTLFPCNECAKAIIQSGIKEVIYRSEEFKKNGEAVIAAKKMFDLANVHYRKYEPTGRNINLSL